jgi:preprotein translocase YajC subunit
MDMLLWNLMSGDGNQDDWTMWVIMGIAVVALIIMTIVNSRAQKKRQQEAQDTLNALKPGCKVKTIGGICGVVVEVNREENTFVLETGNEANGKSYIKFDLVAVYQTDAKKEAAEETPVEEAAAEDKE